MVTQLMAAAPFDAYSGVSVRLAPRDERQIDGHSGRMRQTARHQLAAIPVRELAERDEGHQLVSTARGIRCYRCWRRKPRVRRDHEFLHDGEGHHALSVNAKVQRFNGSTVQRFKWSRGQRGS